MRAMLMLSVPPISDTPTHAAPSLSGRSAWMAYSGPAHPVMATTRHGKVDGMANTSSWPYFRVLTPQSCPEHVVHLRGVLLQGLPWLQIWPHKSSRECCYCTPDTVVLLLLLLFVERRPLI